MFVGNISSEWTKYKVLLSKNNHIVPISGREILLEMRRIRTINVTCMTRKHLVGSHHRTDVLQNRRGYRLLFMRHKDK